MSDYGTTAMSEVKVERTYKRARIYAKTLLWSLGFLAIGISLSFVLPLWVPYEPSEKQQTAHQFLSLTALIPVITALISFLTFVASAMLTTSTILLGWRAERRQSEEFKLKIKQLELQLQEAQAKVMAPAKDT